MNKNNNNDNTNQLQDLNEFVKDEYNDEFRGHFYSSFEFQSGIEMQAPSSNNLYPQQFVQTYQFRSQDSFQQNIIAEQTSERLLFTQEGQLAGGGQGQQQQSKVHSSEGVFEARNSGTLTKGVNTKKQKEVNRHAQKRYRDRKREKLQGLQAEMESLTNEVDELKNAYRDKEKLQIKLGQLSQQFVTVNSEINKFKVKLQKVKSGNDLSVKYDEENFPLPNPQSRPHPLSHPHPHLHPLSHPQTSNQIELAQNILQKMSELKTFIHENSLDPINFIYSDCEQIDNNLKQKLKQLINSLQKIFRETLILDRLNIQTILQSQQQQTYSNLCEGGKASWPPNANPQKNQSIVKNILLSQNQIENLLKIRNEYVDKLQQLFQYRQQINVKIISLILPNQQQLNYDEEVVQEFHSDQTFCMERAIISANLVTQINNLKMNLINEQKLYFQLNDKIIDVLQILQVGWIISLSFPEFYDSLAFVNAVYELYNDS